MLYNIAWSCSKGMCIVSVTPRYLIEVSFQQINKNVVAYCIFFPLSCLDVCIKWHLHGWQQLETKWKIQKCEIVPSIYFDCFEFTIENTTRKIKKNTISVLHAYSIFISFWNSNYIYQHYADTFAMALFFNFLNIYAKARTSGITEKKMICKI